jgi:hypothetical protein
MASLRTLFRLRGFSPIKTGCVFDSSAMSFRGKVEAKIGDMIIRADKCVPQ